MICMSEEEEAEGENITWLSKELSPWTFNMRGQHIKKLHKNKE